MLTTRRCTRKCWGFPPFTTLIRRHTKRMMMILVKTAMTALALLHQKNLRLLQATLNHLPVIMGYLLKITR